MNSSASASVEQDPHDEDTTSEIVPKADVTKVEKFVEMTSPLDDGERGDNAQQWAASRRVKMVLAGQAFVIFVVALDGTVLTTTLPVRQRHAATDDDGLIRCTERIRGFRRKRINGILDRGVLSPGTGSVPACLGRTS